MSNEIYSETIRGMTNVSKLALKKFSNRTSKEISQIYFPKAEKNFFNEIGIITDIDCDCDPDTFLSSADFYFDTNKNKIIGDEGDEFAFKIILHVSKNGNKIKEAYETCAAQEGEIVLFLEDNEGDLSKQILRAKIADDVRERVKSSQYYNSNVLNFVNRNFPLNQETLKKLVENGFIEEEITFSGAILTGVKYFFLVIFSPAKAIGWILKKLGDGVGLLKIDSKYWDTVSDDYFLKRENVIKQYKISTTLLDDLHQDLEDDKANFEFNDLIPDFVTKNIQKAITKIKLFIERYNVFIENKINAIYDKYEAVVKAAIGFTSIPEGIAFFAGLWNGIVDFISTILKFLGSIIESPFDLVNNFQDTLETIDSFFDTIAEIEWEDVSQAFQLIYIQIKAYFKDNKTDDYNWVRVAYTIGFGIVFIASFFIPFAQLTKLGALTKLTKIQKGFFESMKPIVSSTKTHLVSKSKDAYKNGLKLFEQMMRVFAKGKESITTFLNKIWKQIAEWFLKNKKVFQGAKKAVDAYSKRYVGRKLQPLIKSSKAFALYGKAGKNVVKAVDKTVEQILRVAKSNNQLRYDFVMVSGMIFKKGGKLSKAITKTNFSRAEIGKFSSETGKFLDKITGKPSTYQKFLDNLHPILKKRFERHLQEIEKGLKASVDDIARAGRPGSHGEIRALDELLKIIDPTGRKYGDNVFKYIYGYNRTLFTKTGKVQPPCAHCHFLTDLVTYLGL